MTNINGTSVKLNFRSVRQWTETELEHLIIISDIKHIPQARRKTL
ncbi:MAG: hypothetical protein RM021_004850 [Nostoc sp. EkiNYC01]|nr:hypothetical protein [Nostoc sp. EkiNYC01]